MPGPGFFQDSEIDDDGGRTGPATPRKRPHDLGVTLP